MKRVLNENKYLVNVDIAVNWIFYSQLNEVPGIHCYPLLEDPVSDKQNRISNAVTWLYSTDLWLHGR